MRNIKIMHAFLVGAACLLLTGCADAPEENSTRISHSDDFFDQVSIPERVTIDVDFSTLSTVTEARQFTGETINLDPDRIADAFLTGPITSENIWANGLTMFSEEGAVSETLNVDDGGERFGTPTGSIGGFSYSKSLDYNPLDKWSQVANLDEVVFSADEPPHYVNSDYMQETDLSFMPVAQAKDIALDAFSAAGLSDFAICRSVSLDLAVMKSHYQEYWEFIESLGREPENIVDWTVDDECYLFFMKQMVDGLPVVDRMWMRPAGATVYDYQMPVTAAVLAFDHNGIRYARTSNALRIVSEGASSPLISGYDALRSVLDAYSSIIIDRDILIVDTQLCYLLFPDSEEEHTYSLEPGWIVTSRALYGETIKYRNDVVHAVTGDLHPGRF